MFNSLMQFLKSGGLGAPVTDAFGNNVSAAAQQMQQAQQQMAPMMPDQAGPGMQEQLQAAMTLRDLTQGAVQPPILADGDNPLGYDKQTGVRAASPVYNGNPAGLVQEPGNSSTIYEDPVKNTDWKAIQEALSGMGQIALPGAEQPMPTPPPVMRQGRGGDPMPLPELGRLIDFNRGPMNLSQLPPWLRK